MITEKELVSTIIHALEEKKAENVTIINISELSSIADYFVIANGSNSNQIQAMVDSVIEELGKKNVKPRQVEGYQNASWILIDFQDVIVHIFDRESRNFYDLERIWRDGSILLPKDFVEAEMK